ncbi:MAG: hypothetical protein Q8L48_32050 [Archangium sp.]|nr:hypothetical protein [Archangium sp.]
MTHEVRFQPEFRARLLDFEFATLEREQHSVFALSPALALVYFNPAYCGFAASNHGEAVLTKFPVGASLLDAVSGELRPFYEQRLATVRATHTAWHHDYECSSPDTFRAFRQSVYPLANGLGFVLINSLKVEAPMQTRGLEAHAPLDERYLQQTGLFTQCSNCRRTRRNDGSEQWDWVPRYVSERPGNTSHSICLPCRDYYWR